VFKCSAPPLLLGYSSLLQPGPGEQLILVSLWCALAQPFSRPHVNQDSHSTIPSALQVLLPEHDCQTAASRCFYRDQQIPQDDGRTQDIKPFNSALKKCQRRYKNKENEKFSVRMGHEDLHIASPRCNSVSFQVSFHQPANPSTGSSYRSG